jgi:hypothetical protein
MRSLGIPYIGNKLRATQLFEKMLPEVVEAYCDLTIGGCTCPIYFAEDRDVDYFVLNDLSEYSRLMAQALLVDPKIKMTECMQAFEFKPLSGLLSQHSSDVLRGRGGPRAFQEATKRFIDGYCVHNANQPIALIALAAELCSGAGLSPGRFFTTRTQAMDPANLFASVWTRLMSLRQRQQALGPACVKITAHDYLDLPSEILGLVDHVVYLDPAWPSQPGVDVSSNAKIYGFYASTLLSILRQEIRPYPARYDVSDDDFYEGMRATITALCDGNMMLVAYQSTPDRVGYVKERLFSGDPYCEMSFPKGGRSDLFEYLFCV